MFGYVSVNPQTLSDAEKKRFRAFYCGLCHALAERGGRAGRLTLSNDMTFLSLLLAALYEPRETEITARCAPHPVRPHTAVTHEGAYFAADMNLLLAYHKCRDDVLDDGSLRGRAGCALLQKAADGARRRWPGQSAEMEDSLQSLVALEAQPAPDLDALTRWAGWMLGACFVWRQDAFAPYLRAVGEALGRFIYLMDAFEDLEADARRGRFNPLASMRGLPDFSQRVEDILTLEMAQCAQAFDVLPIEQDAGLLRNVLYSGVWGKYAQITRKEKQA